MEKFVTRFPAGFDYLFRPISYFSGLDAKILIVASILGEERRRDVEQRLKQGDFDPEVWGEWLTDPQLDDETRKLLSATHPAFMGGEYLPSLGGDSIEIARVVFASVTQDVISIRATRRRGRIRYLVQDEYDTEFIQSRASSKRPLSLRDLIKLIDGSEHPDPLGDGGLVWSHVRWHVNEGFVEEARDLISVESAFYPELGRYYERVIGEFIDEFEHRRDRLRERASRPKADSRTLDLFGEGPITGKSEESR